MSRILGAKSAVCVGLLLVLSMIPMTARGENLSVVFSRDESFPGSEKGLWAVRLTFDHPVFPSDLQKAVRVDVNGLDAKFVLREPQTNKPTSAPSREFRLVGKSVPPDFASIRIVVGKGLSDATGRRLLGKNNAFEFDRAIDKFYVQDFSTFYRSAKDKGFVLSLSHEISTSDLKKAMKIRPEVAGMSVRRGPGVRNFRITGEFEPGKKYTVGIEETRVKGGSAILRANEYSFSGPGVTPKIVLKTKRSVVELKSRQLFPINLENVTKVRVILKKIPPYLVPELAAALESKKGLKDWKGKKRERTFAALVKSGKVDKVFGGEMEEDSEVFFAREAKDHVYGYSLPLSFRKNPERGGVWMLRLVDPDGVWKEEAAKLVQITDLSVSYKLSANSLLLWVTSIHTGRPVSGVRLLLYGSNGERFFAGPTDGNGLVLVKNGDQLPSIQSWVEAAGASKRPVVLSRLRWVVAATETDGSALKLDTLRLKPFAVKQTKAPEADPEAVRGYIFTERGIYKPGESVFFKLTARAYKENRIVAPENARVKVEIVDPREDVKYSKELTLGDFGTCHDSFPVTSYAPVGTYTIKAGFEKKNKQKEEFTRTFLVQEYKRPRHFVTLSLKQERRPAADYVALKRSVDFLTVGVKGRYYAGGPVKHARAKWKAVLVAMVNKVKGQEGFFFGNEDEKELFLESGESVLDKSGELKLDIPLDSRLLTGLYGVKISVTVLDVDGEPATEVKTFKPAPRFLVGISQHPQRVQSGHSSTLKIIVVDEKGRRIPKGHVTAALMRKDYFYTQKRDSNGNINYLWEEGWMKSVSSRQPITNGEASYQLELNDTGEYMVSFTYEDKSREYSSRTTFKVGWEEYNNWMRRRTQKFSPTSNEILPALTKKEYKVGETVTVEFHTRRPVKKCLVTVEAGDLLDYRLIDVNGKQGKFRFKARKEYRPNVYVSIIGAAGRDGFPVYASQMDVDVPTVYYGYADVRIRTDIKGLTVRIEPDRPELKAKPGEKVRLAFKVDDHTGKGTLSELAVCVVDEAVLALTRFTTPDLSSLTDFNLPLAVFSGDLRLALISQDLFRLFSTRPLTGGGYGAGFVAPSIRKDFRPVAYFNPALKTDKSGGAFVEFQLPDTTTTYRVYAVACDKAAGFASEQRKMMVTKEFFVEPSVPRFLVPGDRAVFPVVVHNKTEEDGVAALQAECSKDLTVSPEKTSVKLAPQSTSVVKSTVRVTGGMEKGRLLFQGKFSGKEPRLTDAIERSFPIHSRYLPARRVKMGHFSQRAEIAVKLPKALKKLDPKEINPGDFSAHLTLGRTDWNKIAPGLKYLLRYPYGCVEQTSSGIIPLAGLRGLIGSGLIPGIETTDVDKFLKRGVARLLSMQQAEGGFSYWPGRPETSWWGTLYATFALTTARENGYDVPEDRMKRALKFLRDNMFGKKRKDRFHGAAWTRELALYNLAVNKMLTPAELKPFFDEYSSLPDQGKALLLLSAQKIGYLPRAKLVASLRELHPEIDMTRVDYRNSSFRTVAMCLMAAMETSGAPKEAENWAGSLIKGLRPQGRWYSTADTGWCLLALGKYFKEKGAGKARAIPCTIKYGGERPLEVTVSDASIDLELNPHKLMESGKIILETDSKELVYYTLSLTYPDMARDPSELSRGFSLLKRIENLNGKKEIRVGDVVKITLEIRIPLTATGNRFRNLEYLALEDPAPAGLVPINSELETEGVLRGEPAESEAAPWRDGFYEFRPTYSEFRDDGVKIFKNRAWTGAYKYSYLARAVVEGEFWMRGSHISLMYAPDTFGKTKGRQIKVLPAAK